MARALYGTCFGGNEASDYAKEHGYLDYYTFSRAFDNVLNNDIISKTQDIGYWEQVSPHIDHSDEIDELEDQRDELEEKINEIDDQIDEVDEDDDNADGVIEQLNAQRDQFEEQYRDIDREIDKLREDEDYDPDIYQYYIVDDNGADLIQRYTNDPLFYNEELDMYVWGITHYGTSWSYVLTDIKLNAGEEAWK